MPSSYLGYIGHMPFINTAAFVAQRGTLKHIA